MIASYECEQCFRTYDSENKFIHCAGDTCRESVCKDCAKKCKNPECTKWVCNNCLEGSSKQYCGEYCVKCSMWSEDEDGEWHNFDFAKRDMSHSEGLKFLKKYPTGQKTTKKGNNK